MKLSMNLFLWICYNRADEDEISEPSPVAITVTKQALIMAGIAVSLAGCESLPLHSSEARIKEHIVAVTPIGTGLTEAKSLITKRIRPKSVNEMDTLQGKTLIARLGTIDEWPLPFFALRQTYVECSWLF